VCPRSKACRNPCAAEFRLGEEVVYGLLFRFLIDDPTQFNGRNVVPTPSSTLSTQTRYSGGVPDHILAAFDEGTMVFALVRLSGPPGEAEERIVARFSEAYAYYRAVFREAYKHTWGRYPEVSRSERRCASCNGPLRTTRSDARYCRNACRQAAHRRRRAAACRRYAELDNPVARRRAAHETLPNFSEFLQSLRCCLA
jgi:hypothetical protein